MIQGFSKKTKTQKRQWLQENFPSVENKPYPFALYDNPDDLVQTLHDDFIENTIANYYLPLGVAPNFCINDTIYAIPMATEESSVVAGVSKSAKFWAERGGFHSQVIGTEKVGQVHFFYQGDPIKLTAFFNHIRPKLYQDTQSIALKMTQRGGGITNISLIDKTQNLSNYYQLYVTFETLDAMGANFINSCLEQFARTLKEQADKLLDGKLEVLMSILSNYVPNCLVKVQVQAPVSKMGFGGLSGYDFSYRFVQALSIANADVYRAVTHNKGIANGIDAVVIATGNDFRAVEAGIHAYASRTGQYKSLSQAQISDGIFSFSLEVPLALGTVGGLTRLHPMAKASLELLQNPSATQLMQIIGAVGLAQNFAAVGALITKGIQHGHMKMHLSNIINQLEATPEHKQQIMEYFADKPITFNRVSEFLEQIKSK